MNHQISPDLLNRAIAALFPETTDDSAATPGPTRNAEGHLNPQAWSQVLTLFLWFGFDPLPLHAHVVAEALAEDIEFPTKLLSVRPIHAEYIRMVAAIEETLSIAAAVSAVSSLRSAVETMAEVLRDAGEHVEPWVLPQLREAIDALDEQIDKRIETEGETV